MLNKTENTSDFLEDKTPSAFYWKQIIRSLYTGYNFEDTIEIYICFYMFLIG